MRQLLTAALLLTTGGCASAPTLSPAAAESDQLLTIDHYVRVKSAAPSMNGQMAQIYVRERALPRTILCGASGVVLFVHGAGTPAEVVTYATVTEVYGTEVYVALNDITGCVNVLPLSRAHRERLRQRGAAR